jgi:DNA-binding SARP family transcriptional activator
MLEANDLYALRLNFLLHGQALVAQGDLQGAVSATEEGVRAARVFGPARELGIALQQLATVVARLDDWPRAVSLLREALDALQRDPMLLFTARALELMASGATAAGEAAEAAQLYGAAESIRESIGAAMWSVDRSLHGPYLDRARAALGGVSFRAMMAKGKSLDAAGGVALALAVGDKLGAATEPDRTWDTREYQVPQVTRESPVPSLRVRSLGGLEVMVNGVALGRKDWTYSKARELLVFLLLHNEGRTREQIGAALWPDASSTQLRNSFHVALHHLRRALGSTEWIRYEHDRYRLDVSGTVDFDATAFEEAVTRGLRAGRSGPLPVVEMSHALEHYRGDFLEGEQVGDWYLELRDRLSRLYSDALETLGAALVKSGQASDAIPLLERLLRREPVHESGYRELMRARAQGGDLAGALRDYRQLEAVLRREGFKGPGRETQELLRQLQG